MPSPLGHALGGAIVGLMLAPASLRTAGAPRTEGGRGRLSALGTVGALALVACLPDLDFLWARHNAETHSLGAAVFAGAVVLAWTRGRQPTLAVAVTLAWSSHVLLDWLGSDDTPPLGVMALWPATDAYYFAHAYVFEAISRRYWLQNFVAHNTWAILKEMLLLGPIALALAWLTGKVKGGK